MPLDLYAMYAASSNKPIKPKIVSCAVADACADDSVGAAEPRSDTKSMTDTQINKYAINGKREKSSLLIGQYQGRIPDKISSKSVRRRVTTRANDFSTLGQLRIIPGV